jgi:hypothetical protein
MDEAKLFSAASVEKTYDGRVRFGVTIDRRGKLIPAREQHDARNGLSPYPADWFAVPADLKAAAIERAKTLLS